MKKLNRILFETFVILLTRVWTVRSGCSWESSSQTNCVISCSSTYTFSGSETTEQVLEDLEQKWNQRDNCHAEGIYLTLSGGMVYPNLNVKANWFTANVKVKELTFNLSPVSTMDVNALNSTAFKFVTSLTFPNMGLDLISKGIFNGLESLEVLVMEGAKLKTIQTGVLDVLSDTLKHFSLIASSNYWSEINIDGFTGSQPLKALEYVKINYNLKSTITHKSFVGLENVKTLDLSECQIVSIGNGAFDSMSNSIKELNLKNNLITTLPEGLFDYMLPNQATTIMLDGNKWDCDCHLMPFKIYLMENSNFVGTYKCSTPSYHSGQIIVDFDFCDTYVPSSTTPRTTPTITTSTSTTSSTTTSSITEAITSSTKEEITSSTPEENTTNISTEPTKPEEFSQECYEAGKQELSKTVSIKNRRAGLIVNENEFGDVVVEVDTFTENSILVWFSLVDQETYYSASDEITCVIGETKSIPVANLREDTAYTFCLMDSAEKTVSPLDCISYAKRNTSEQPWLFNSSKSLVISLAIVACSISMFIGMAIGIFALKTNKIIKERNENRKANACINEVLKETFQSNSIMRQQHRMSNVTADSFNTKRTTNVTVDYYLSQFDTAPPLPARPQSMHLLDEPIYAVVRDTGIVK